MPSPSDAPTERAPTLAGDDNQPGESTDDAAARAASVTLPTPALSNGRWGVLAHKHYRNVLLAQVLSNIGTWTEMFAIQMFVAKKTGRLDDQGTLGMCQQLPIFVLGIFGGLAADRVNRRTLLVVTQVMAGLVAIGVALVVTYNNIDGPDAATASPEALAAAAASGRSAIHWLFALGVAYGCVMAFNFPAWQVLTPRLVPREDLMNAITLNGIQFNMARIIGPAIAGLVLAKYGAPPLLWFNAATFIMMAGVVMTTPDDPAPPKSKDRLLAQVGEAWSFLLHNRGPRAVLLAQVALCLLAAPMVRMLSNFVLAVYHLGDTVPPWVKHFGMTNMQEFVGGTLLGTQGLGAVLGGICLKFVPKWYPKHHFIPLSVAALGLSITAFSLTRTLWVGYVAMGVCGWFWMWAFNQSWAALQVLIPDSIRGRAMSITNVAAFGAMALGALIAGFGGEQLKVHDILDDAWATQASIFMLSVPLALAGIWMMIYRVPEVDGMPAASADERRIARSLVHAITAKEHWPARGVAIDGQGKVEAIQEQEPM